LDKGDCWSPKKVVAQGKIPNNFPDGLNTENFIGREDDLAKLHEMLQGQALQGANLPTVLIVGMAGMGKSELARQYGKLHLDDFAGGVGIVNAAHFAEDIREFMQPRFCEDRDLRYERTLKAQVAEGWQAWQKFCGAERLALIIIDDVKDYQTEVAPYLPTNLGDRNPFRFVLTSRSQLRGDLAVHEIKELTNTAAVQVLAKWAEPNQQTVLENPAIAKSLCDRLGCLPLALTLVGSWLSIAERTLAMAIAALEKEGLASAVLEPDREDIRQKAERGLKAAFAMSWKPLSTDAQQLGRVLSLFEPINLPWELVEAVVQAYPKQSAAPPVRRGWWKIWDNPMVQIESPFVPIRDLVEAKIALRKTSLLQSVEQGKTYRLHRLVHEFLGEQWQDGDRDGWQDAWLRGLSDRANEIPAFASWELVTGWQPLRPHFASAQKFVEDRLKSATNTALVNDYKLQKNNLVGGSFRLNQAPIFEATYRQAQSTHDRAKAALAKGESAAAQNYFGEAIKGYQRAIEQARLALPKNSMIFAGYLHAISVLFYELGNYKEGIPTAEEAVKIAKIKASPLTLATYLNRLGLFHDSQGNYNEAETLYARSLKIRESQLRVDHPDVATSLNNLAYLYDLQGKYSEAEPLYLRSIEIWERQLGADHPDVATSLNNLAGLYKAQGKYSEAESLYRRSLEIRERQLGADHLYVATSLNNLAGVYKDQGKYSEAELLYLRSIEIRERKTSSDHPDVAVSLMNLANLYDFQGKYSEAETLALRSLEIRERKLGADHPGTAFSLNNLANLYYSQGKYREAEPLYLRAMEIRERKLGVDHPDFAFTLNNLANLYSSQGKYNQAEPLLLRSLEIRERKLGADHPDVATSLFNLAGLYLNTQRHSEAMQSIQRAIQIYKKKLGIEHPDTQNALSGLQTIREASL
jgi:tetratricopeptide (TPR) repeat protein